MNIAELATNLRLAYVKNNYAEIAGKPKLSHEEFLLQLLEGEWENRVENGSKRRIKEAKFPYKKYLCDFKRDKYGDEFIPEFDEIETLDFIEKNENIILIGTSGAGKTHYANHDFWCSKSKCNFFVKKINTRRLIPVFITYFVVYNLVKLLCSNE